MHYSVQKKTKQFYVNCSVFVERIKIKILILGQPLKCHVNHTRQKLNNILVYFFVIYSVLLQTWFCDSLRTFVGEFCQLNTWMCKKLTN